MTQRIRNGNQCPVTFHERCLEIFSNLFYNNNLFERTDLWIRAVYAFIFVNIFLRLNFSGHDIGFGKFMGHDFVFDIFSGGRILDSKIFVEHFSLYGWHRILAH